MNTVRNYFIAKLAHEINNAYAFMLGETPIAWDNLGETVKNGVIDGVKLTLEGKTPKELHEAWLVSRIRDGWTLGPVKDPEKKEHPCLVPFRDLSAARRIKDRIFRATVFAAEKLWMQAQEAS
jgi:hypothetical protein